MEMSVRDSTRTWPRVWLIVYLCLLAAASIWVLFGGAMLSLVLIVLAPALTVARARMSLAVAIVLLLAAASWSTVVVFTVSRYSGAPPLVLVLVVTTAVGCLCAVRLYRSGSAFTRIDGADLTFLSAGAIIWCGVLLLAKILPSGSPVSWAMGGDAANNILFARTLLEQGGITLGAGANPVPLTAALIALFMLPGRTFASPTVEADILAIAQMWGAGIAAACLVSGALVLALLRKRTAMGYVAVAVGSMLPLTWMILAGSIALGFVNFHLTLALILGCVVILLRPDDGLVLSIVGLSVSLTLILALWAPLAAIPGLALLALVITKRRAVVRLRGWRLVLAIGAVVQSALYFAAMSLPSFLTQGGALAEATGAVFEFNVAFFAAVASFAVVLGGGYAWANRSMDAIRGLGVVVVGGGLGLVALLWLRRNDEGGLWGYYQLKYLWLFIAILFVVAIAFGVAFAVSIEKANARSAMAFFGVLVIAAGFVQTAKVTIPDYRDDLQLQRDTLIRILKGDFGIDGRGDRIFERVVELADAETPSILWSSNEPDESAIMFWIIQMASSGADDYDLRILAYVRDLESADDLCTVRELMRGKVTVITASEDVADAAASACPELGDVVVTQ